MKKLLTIGAMLSVVLLGLVSVQSFAQEGQQFKTDKVPAAWTPGTNAGGPGFGKVAGVKGDGWNADNARDTDIMVYTNGTINAIPSNFGQIYGNRYADGVGGQPLGNMTILAYGFNIGDPAPAGTTIAGFLQPADPVNASNIFARTTIFRTGFVNAGPNFTSPAFIVRPGTELNGITNGTTGYVDTAFVGFWNTNATANLPMTGRGPGLTVTPAPAGPGFRGYTANSCFFAPNICPNTTVPMAPRNFNVAGVIVASAVGIIPVELMSFDAEPGKE